MIDMIPQTAKSMIMEAAIYVPFNSEGVRISHCEDDAFYGEGEETGESYKITYDEVDLSKDMIYKLVLVNA